MKVLITGAAGQLGTALQGSAPAEAQITAIDVAECDLTDSSALRELIVELQPDILLNAAAYTAVDRAESEEELAQAINANAVATMVSAIDECGGRLVHVSTDFVFDGEASRAYQAGDQRNPISAYGRTKAAGEDALRPSDILVRTAWVYAAGGANFVRTMVRLMRERDELGVVADQIGAPTWASSLAKVLWGLVDTKAEGVFHYSDAGVASWYDFAVAIAEEAHDLGLIERIPTIRPLTTEDYPTPAKRPKFSLLDSRSTHSQIGTEPVHWRTNLRLMLKEEQSLG